MFPKMFKGEKNEIIFEQKEETIFHHIWSKRARVWAKSGDSFFGERSTSVPPDFKTFYLHNSLFISNSFFIQFIILYNIIKTCIHCKPVTVEGFAGSWANKVFGALTFQE